MEVDVIILSKEGSKYKLQLGMKQTIRNVFKKIYSDVKDESFQFDLDGEYVKLNISCRQKTLICCLQNLNVNKRLSNQRKSWIVA